MLWLYFCMCIVFIGAVINRMYPSIFWRLYVLWKRRRGNIGSDENTPS
jgi:uncharacterized BrkB/YihY/UPF0761 family membrane protein